MVEAGEAGQLEVAGAQVRVELEDHLQQMLDTRTVDRVLGCHVRNNLRILILFNVFVQL